MPEVKKRHYRETLLLAYPVALTQLSHMMAGIADSVMVGKIGAAPLAAASLANGVFSIFLLFCIGISYGLTPLIAKADSEGKKEQIGKLFKNSLAINTSVVTTLAILLFFGADLLHHVGQDAEVAALAVPYLRILTCSMLPLILFFTGKQFAEGLSLTKQAMYAGIVANLANVGMNYLFIYGFAFIPAMGLNGAGLATLIARVIMGIWLLIYILFGKTFASYREILLDKSIRVSKKLCRDILRIGIPSGFQFIFEVGAFAAAAVMAGRIGKYEQAAHQIALTLAAASYMAVSGLGSAAAVRVGKFLGSNDVLGMKKSGFAAVYLAVLFMAFCAGIFIFGNHALPPLFMSPRSPDFTTVTKIASLLLIIAAFFQLSDGIQVVTLGALRGLGDAKIPSAISFLAYWVVGIPLGYILAFHFHIGVKGIWIGLLTGLSVSAALLLLRFNKLIIKKMKKN